MSEDYGCAESFDLKLLIELVGFILNGSNMPTITITFKACPLR